jgi:hypothetical protein
MVGIAYVLLGCIPSLAGLAFINILKRGRGWYQVPFWILLVVLNLLVMFWVASSTDALLSISSFSACFFTPVAAIASVLVMRVAWRRLEACGKIDASRKRWFLIGLVLIPALHIMAFVALLLFAPLLCKTGQVVCRNS